MGSAGWCSRNYAACISIRNVKIEEYLPDTTEQLKDFFSIHHQALFHLLITAALSKIIQAMYQVLKCTIAHTVIIVNL
jgi:hypothetical protein